MYTFIWKLTSILKREPEKPFTNRPPGLATGDHLLNITWSNQSFYYTKSVVEFWNTTKKRSQTSHSCIISGVGESWMTEKRHLFLSLHLHAVPVNCLLSHTAKGQGSCPRTIMLTLENFMSTSTNASPVMKVHTKWFDFCSILKPCQGLESCLLHQAFRRRDTSRKATVGWDLRIDSYLIRIMAKKLIIPWQEHTGLGADECLYSFLSPMPFHQWCVMRLFFFYHKRNPINQKHALTHSSTYTND